MERATPSSWSRSFLHFIREFPLLLLLAFGLAALLKTFVFQAFYIPSGSMEPTLAVGDRVIVLKFIYRFREPRRGEIIVFTGRTGVVPSSRSAFRRVVEFFAEGLGFPPPGERDFIKRVIGLPGDVVEVREGSVFVNGSPLEEPYVVYRDGSSFGPVTVPQGQYFVMGDNRPNSSDSRGLLGMISSSQILGEAVVRIWPPSRLGGLGPGPRLSGAARGQAAVWG